MNATAPPRPPRLRLGLACTGWIADWAVHAPISDGVPVQVVFVASRDRERARRYAAAHRISEHGTWGELLAHPDVDAVYLATPNAGHVSLAAEAVRSGKHVLVEKPLGRNPAAVEELMALAASHKRVVHEAFHYADHPTVARSLEAVRHGAVGRLRWVNVEYGWFLERPEDIRLLPELDGGAFADVGCYGVDLLHRLVPSGWRVREVASTRGRTGVDLDSEVRLEADGVDAMVRASLRSRTTGSAVSVLGTTAIAHLSSPFLPVPPPGVEIPGFTVRRRTLHGGVGGSDGGSLWPAEEVNPRSSYHHQLAAFASRVASRAPVMPERGLVDRAAVLEQVHDRMKENR